MRHVRYDLRSLFDALTAAGVPVVVLRSGAEVIEGSSRDVDMLVPGAHRRMFEKLLASYALAEGYRLFRVIERPHVSMYKYVRARGTRCSIVQFDIMYRRFGWMGLEYLSSEEVVLSAIRGRYFSVPSPLHEVAIKLLLNLLVGGQVKPDHLSEAQEYLAADHGELAGLLRDRFPGADGEAIVGWLRDGDVRSVLRHARLLKMRLLVRQLRRAPWAALNGVAATAWAEIGRYLHVPGLAVAVRARSAEEAAYLADGVIERLRGVFKGGYIRQVRALDALERVTLVSATGRSGLGRVLRETMVTLRTRLDILRDRLVVLVTTETGEPRVHPSKRVRSSRWLTRSVLTIRPELVLTSSGEVVGGTGRRLVDDASVVGLSGSDATFSALRPGEELAVATIARYLSRRDAAYIARIEEAMVGGEAQLAAEQRST